MGWWAIIDENNPGIDWAEESTSGLCMGDVPADIMGQALDDIREAWKQEWDREPKESELRACFNFCCPSQDELDGKIGDE